MTSSSLTHYSSLPALSQRQTASSAVSQHHQDSTSLSDDFQFTAAHNHTQMAQLSDALSQAPLLSATHSQASQLSAANYPSQVPLHSAASQVAVASSSQANVSRTTKWRRSKNSLAQKRKVYRCKHCGEPTAGHPQEGGHRYRAKQPGHVSLEE